MPLANRANRKTTIHPTRLGYGTHLLYASQPNDPYVRVRCPVQEPRMMGVLVAHLSRTLVEHRWITTGVRVNLRSRWPQVVEHHTIYTRTIQSPIPRYPASCLMLTNHPLQLNDLERPTHPLQCMPLGNRSPSPRKWICIPLSLRRLFVPQIIIIVKTSMPRGKRQALAARNLWRVSHRSRTACHHHH